MPDPGVQLQFWHWLVLGVLFMFSAAYLDVTDPWAKLYFGTGTICLLWSLWVVSARLRHRKPDGEEGTQSETGEVSSEKSDNVAAE